VNPPISAIKDRLIEGFGGKSKAVGQMQSVICV